MNIQLRNNLLKNQHFLLNKLNKYYSSKNISYTKSDTSRSKAVWMLQVDALDALQDSLEMTAKKSIELQIDYLETL